MEFLFLICLFHLEYALMSLFDKVSVGRRLLIAMEVLIVLI